MIFARLLLASSIFITACGDTSGPRPAIKDYETARSVFWQSLYPDGGETLYCQQRFSSGSRSGINIEHIFPMGWVTNSLDCGTRKQCRAKSSLFNRIEADLHNLYPARADVNYQRSAYAFSEIGGETRRFGANCDFEVDERARRAEPPPATRGEVARAMFYMADRYGPDGLMLFKKQAQLLMQWHQMDQPSKHEHERNDLIEQLQGNRNPFIDDPETLEKLVKQGHFH